MPTATPPVGLPLRAQLDIAATRALGLRGRAQSGREKTNTARDHRPSPARARRFHRLARDHMVKLIRHRGNPDPAVSTTTARAHC